MLKSTETFVDDEFIKDETQATLTCPECGGYERLWAGVTAEVEGFREVTVEKTPNGPVLKYSEPPSFEYADYDNVQETNIMRCGDCAWLGTDDDLRYDAPILLGWDGKPRKRIPANQMRFDEDK